MQNIEYLKDLIANEYLNSFFGFYVKRASSIQDAEDLTQKAAYECLNAINRVKEITNINSYFWSIAHNVYKNYLNRRVNYILDDDYCKMNIVDINYDDKNQEMHNCIRKSLSILSGLYRKIIVLYYYHDLKIKDIANELNISQDMVKYYLTNGKKKLKEIYYMNKEIGEVSFNPKDFSIYYSGIDFASIDIWQLFKRKLPCQIVLICYNKPKTISEIASLIGCSSCYIEDEISILQQAGVIIEKVKHKYQTNFYIISKDEINVITNLYNEMYLEYTKELDKVFNENLEQIKKTNIYQNDATIDQYKWIFVSMVANIDRRNILIKESDYPRILSCGSRAIIYGLEARAPKGVCGQTPTYLNDYIMWAKDLWNIKEHSLNQFILKDKQIAQTVIEVFNGIIDVNNKELYAYLIKNNILVKENEVLKTNIAYLNKEFLKLMESINNNLYIKLETKTKKIKNYLFKIVNKTIPNSLTEYVNGYVFTLMDFFANNIIIQSLINNNFLNDKLNNIQVSYFVDK